MNQPSNTPFSGSDLRYPSAASLQAAHEELVKRRRVEGDTPELLADIHAFIMHGCGTGSLLDGDNERRASQALLDYWSNALIRLGEDPGDATLHEFDPLLAPNLPDELCPYVGLDSFSETKTSFFFGRQRLVQTLIDKVASDRLLIVSGPSGSGKSSAVLAGLMPALKNGAIPGSQDWRYIPRMVPGSDPLANLARLLWEIGGETETDQDAWIKEQVDQLRRNPDHLTRLASENYAAPVVGVIDQFEEAFTLCTDNVTRQAFVANLLNLVKTPGCRHTVILTVRTDFESFFVLLPDLQAEFEGAMVRMTPLNAAELREAIEQPAALVGLKFESGLVDALLHDILGEPAALPLLQFTLLKLWDRRQRNLITWEAYKRLGGGRLALARSADEFYDSLLPEDKVTARRILMRLVRPTEGLEITSNRVRLETLLQQGDARDRVERVLEKFFAVRLLRVTEGDVASDTQVEIAHEALIRNWPRLVEWLDAERDQLRKRVRLTSAAEQWNAIGRSKDALWRGALLEEAAQYRELTDLEQEFIAASRQMQADEAVAAERARQREIEQARALAEAERLRAEEQQKAASRYRRLTAALAVVSILAIGAALIAIVLAQSAGEQRRNAVAARTTAEARLKVAEDALGGQLNLLDQLEIAQAEKATQAVLIQTLEASSGRTPSLALNTPVAALTPTRPGRATSTPTTTWTPSPTLVASLTTETPATRTPSIVVRAATATAAAAATRHSQIQSAQTTTALAMQALQEPAATATAAALATLRSQVQATQTAIAGGVQDLVAIVPDISLNIRTVPATDGERVETVRSPTKLKVLEFNNDLWARVQTSSGNTGWTFGHWLTYEGNVKLLPTELAYRSVTDRADLEFVYGQIVSHDGTTKEYFLLRDPTDATSRITPLGLGAKVTVLAIRDGIKSYGSGKWYVVTLVDPRGGDRLLTAYLPVEAVGPQQPLQ